MLSRTGRNLVRGLYHNYMKKINKTLPVKFLLTDGAVTGAEVLVGNTWLSISVHDLNTISEVFSRAFVTSLSDKTCLSVTKEETTEKT